MKLQTALKDDKINILRMTLGYRGQKQIILCKKKKMNPNIPYLFVPNKEDPPKSRPVSEFVGAPCQSEYNAKYGGERFSLKYIAYVNDQIKIDPKSLDLFCEELCDDALNIFNIWAPSAPRQYFSDATNKYVVIFRVWKIKKAIPFKYSLFRKGREFVDIWPAVDVELEGKVLDDDSFEKQRNQILGFLSPYLDT